MGRASISSTCEPVPAPAITPPAIKDDWVADIMPGPDDYPGLHPPGYRGRDKDNGTSRHRRETRRRRDPGHHRADQSAARRHHVLRHTVAMNGADGKVADQLRIFAVQVLTARPHTAGARADGSVKQVSVTLCEHLDPRANFLDPAQVLLLQDERGSHEAAVQDRIQSC